MRILDLGNVFVAIINTGGIKSLLIAKSFEEAGKEAKIVLDGVC